VVFLSFRCDLKKLWLLVSGLKHDIETNILVLICWHACLKSTTAGEGERDKMEGGNLSRSISRSLSRSSWRMEGVFASGRYSRRASNIDEDEEALKWAAIERLPTYDRLRTSILQTFAEGDHARPNTLQHREVDVRKLDVNERQEFIDRIFKVAEEDNEKYLSKFRNRLEK